MVIFLLLIRIIIYNIILYIMSNVGQKAKDAGEAVFGGVFDATKAVGKITSSTADAAVSAANTGKILVDVTGETAIGVVSNSGKALTAAAGTAAKTVETVENLSARLENYTKEAQKQAQIKNETATFEIKNANDVDKAKIEADRQAKLQEIQNDLERKQKETAAEQERLLADLTANQTQAYLDTTDNISKQQNAYYYGFTKNNPRSRDTGFKKSSMPFSKWCYSYIPNSFLKSDNTGVIDIIFPEQPPTGTRSYEISAIDKVTRQPITITFRTYIKKNWFRKIYKEELPVIIYNYNQDNEKEVEGIMDYHQIWFVCPTTNRGGRRRRTNKRRTNKRRTNRRTNRRQRTNKRRTTNRRR
jgi:hypothetical protein